MKTFVENSKQDESDLGYAWRQGLLIGGLCGFLSRYHKFVITLKEDKKLLGKYLNTISHKQNTFDVQF